MKNKETVRAELEKIGAQYKAGIDAIKDTEALERYFDDISGVRDINYRYDAHGNYKGVVVCLEYDDPSVYLDTENCLFILCKGGVIIKVHVNNEVIALLNDCFSKEL